MNRLKIFTVAMMLTGCMAQAQNLAPTPSPSIVSSPQSTPAPGARSKRLTLTLTLSAQEDLKVREGDIVVVGQVLSDRTRERQRLESQKAQVEIQIQRLKQPPIKPLEPKRISDVAAFPAASFLEEVAGVDKQTLNVEKVRRDRELQVRKIDVIQTMPDLPPSTLLHESEKLHEKETALSLSESELELSKAKLDRAKKDYEYKEYQYSLELSKREIDIQRQQQEYQRQMQEFEKQERDRTFQLSQVSTRLQDLETQLAAVSINRAPSNGKIQRVKWLGQNNQNISVELILVTNDLRSRPITNPVTSPQSTSSPNKEASPTAPGTTFNTETFTR